MVNILLFFLSLSCYYSVLLCTEPLLDLLIQAVQEHYKCISILSAHYAYFLATNSDFIRTLYLFRGHNIAVMCAQMSICGHGLILSILCAR